MTSLDISWLPNFQVFFNYTFFIIKHICIFFEQVDSEPTAIEFRWSFNSTPGISKDLTRHSKEENGTSVLTYVPHEAADYGTLQCWGRNEIGWQRISCTYHIVPAGKPDPPQNCISTNVTHHSIVVKCQKGFDGGKFFIMVNGKILFY